MSLNSVDEILDFAIEREQEAVDFYLDLAGKMKNPQMKRLFEGFAGEERGHKAKLQTIKADKKLAAAAKEVKTLNIADYLVDVEIAPHMSYQDALIVAMKKEKAAFKLYTDLGSRTVDPPTQEIFFLLAQEEAKHKLRFEIEYDEYVLTEN